MAPRAPAAGPEAERLPICLAFPIPGRIRHHCPRKAALLTTVFGPTEFIDGFEYGALIRRTSPFGGARQELDAYLATPHVTGIPAGLFHYNAREHSLELLREGFTHTEAGALCAHQEDTGQAAFITFVTAAWKRIRAKNRHPRTYRVSHLNAGHLGQTSALAATALGLGPFQSAAFDDTAVEDRPGLDSATTAPSTPSLPDTPPPALRPTPPT
ncbi:SagB/ThcOx family dehydrogenase [Streptomyces sp. NPDC048644]|uniref:SagB/ThcOx family dehydrogenase n=1 Tax=Streptomyces sp. NPDC048644 TaxID=3365582 RepID=UPI003721BA45